MKMKMKLSVAFLATLMVSVKSSAIDVEARCNYYKDREPYHCYIETIYRDYCNQQCKEYALSQPKIYLNKDCPWGDNENYNFVCSTIHQSNCNIICNATHDSDYFAMAVNCCKTCLDTCQSVSQRLSGFRCHYLGVYPPC